MAAKSNVVTKLQKVATANFAEYFSSFDAKHYIPNKNNNFVPFGEYDALFKAIERGGFFPVYISGLSGNGKTASVVNICAELGRPLVRIQMSGDTNEGDLIGKYELVDGDTVFVPGPVLLAMELGAVLLIDEFTVAREDVVFAIQSVLEGNGVFVKKLNQKFEGKPGFTIIATANTKGQGLDRDYKYIANKVMDESTLDRFATTFEWDYPPKEIEYDILMKYAITRWGNDWEKVKLVAEHGINCLVNWADALRVAYKNGNTTEMMTTRRLLHIVNSWYVYEDLTEAINRGVARFDEGTQKAMQEAWELQFADVDIVEEEYVVGNYPHTASDGTVYDNLHHERRIVMVNKKTREVIRVLEDGLPLRNDDGTISEIPS